MNNLVKITALMFGMSCLAAEADAQFGKRLLDRVKREAENKVEQKVNDAVAKAVDKTVDEAVEGTKNVEEQQQQVVTETAAQPVETVAKDPVAEYDKLVADARRAISEDNYHYFEVKDRKAEINSAAQEAGVTTTMGIVKEINAYLASFNNPQAATKSSNVATRTTSTAKPASSGSSTAKPASSSSNTSNNNDPFAGKRPSNLGTSSGRVHDGKSTTFGEVSSNGEIKYKGSFVCKIDSKGVIYDRSNKVIGQVDRDGYIYKLVSAGRYDKIGRVDSNGNVYNGSSRAGQITNEIKDASGKSLTGVLPHGVNKVHIGVMMFLNKRF